MELHELHVPHHRAGPVGHGLAVAGGHQRVGGVGEHLAGAAAGQDDRPGQGDRELSLPVQGDGPHAAARRP